VPLSEQARSAWERALALWRVRLEDPAIRPGAAAAQGAPAWFAFPPSVTVDPRYLADHGLAHALWSMFAHEIGHHVQNVLGILPKVQSRQQQSEERVANQLSVRVELMADCLAGVWAKNSNDKYNSLEPGDIEEAMQAASAIGDDKLQKQSQGYAVPDSFTHGSSDQRMRWFMTGYKSGQTKSCDTFRAARN
jgi:predicted metalloprotease